MILPGFPSLRSVWLRRMSWLRISKVSRLLVSHSICNRPSSNVADCIAGSVSASEELILGPILNRCAAYAPCHGQDWHADEEPDDGDEPLEWSPHVLRVPVQQ